MRKRRKAGEVSAREATMSIDERILEIRSRAGLTQQEMADRLFVTRQAVSRWERGETVPGIDTLRLIAEAFDVRVDQILELPGDNRCESCGMPLADPSLLGTEADGSPATRYCKWCYEGGGYTAPDITMDEMADVCVSHLAAPGSGFTEAEARDYMEGLLPRLKRWSR